MFDPKVLPLIQGMNTTVMWIAVTIGLLLFIIGYFAGGRLTKGRILLCTIMVTMIGVLGMKVPMMAFSLISKQFDLESVLLYQEEGKQPQKVISEDPLNPNPPTNDSSEEPEGVRLSLAFQILVLILYTVWVAFLVSMGIFFYETLIVTAEEIDKN